MEAQRADVSRSGGRAPRAWRRRTATLAAVAVLAPAAVLAGVLASSGSAGAPATSPRVTSGSLAAFKKAMIAKLHAGAMRPHWVVCVRSGARFHGAAVVRCNVDFGDPHIQAYCSVFRSGRLVTSADDAAIPCRPDQAGYTQTITSSG